MLWPSRVQLAVLESAFYLSEISLLIFIFEFQNHSGEDFLWIETNQIVCILFFL